MLRVTTGILRVVVGGLLIATFSSCATISGKGYIERGVASYYGPGFEGRKTANGERFHSKELTAAHRDLPFGTRLRVRNLANNREVVVRVNDRGPYVDGRIIDLSQEAARRLGMITAGEAQVELTRD